MQTSKVFRDVVNNNTDNNNSEFVKTNSTSAQSYISLLLNSIYFYPLLTFVVVFIILYLLNPPFVQKTETDMSTPTPNINIILSLSLVAALVVIVAARRHIIS